MTREQLIKEIRQLPLEQKIDLLEAISRSVREEMEANGVDAAISGKEIPAADVQNERERRVAAVQRLRGIIKFEGDPPTDEELKDEYANYLMEKYS